jgi:hypothetical protein
MGVPEEAVVATVMKQIFENLQVRCFSFASFLSGMAHVPASFCLCVSARMHVMYPLYTWSLHDCHVVCPGTEYLLCVDP